MEEQQLYDKFAIDKFVGAPWPTTTSTSWVPAYVDALGQRPNVFVCPTDSPDLCSPLEPGSNVAVGLQHTLRAGDCAASGNYAGVMGYDGPPENGYINPEVKHGKGAFNYIKKLGMREFSDGLSKTMFVGEAVVSDVPKTTAAAWQAHGGAIIWSLAYRFSNLRTSKNPINTPSGEGFRVSASNRPRSNGAFQSRHRGGAQFLFGDGSVHLLSENIDHLNVYVPLSTRKGGEEIKGSF
jgi:prepilin-type processing-associated H-X9-DG protein